jgi:hypothetical protein
LRKDVIRVVFCGMIESPILRHMTMMKTTRKKITLSALPPTEAELAAWNALTRDEQVEHYRELLQSPECNTFTDDTPEEILAAARERVAARRRG